MKGKVIRLTVTSGSLTEAAYRRIRSMILYQELRPGERTSVFQLAGVTGLGRAPIKSAIERLAAEGLLDVRGRSGTSVAKLDATSMTQLFELRSIYEDAAAVLIAQRVTDKQIDAVMALVPYLSNAPQGNGRPSTRLTDRVEFIDNDVEFHRLILACANNPYLLSAYSSLNLHLLISHYLILDGGSHSLQREREHVKIAAALKERNSDRLALALREHATAVQDAILSTMSEFELAHQR